MPIAFPPEDRFDITDWRHQERLLTFVPGMQVQVNPNFSGVAEFTGVDLAPGLPMDFELGRHSNVGRSLGRQYEDVGQAARLNPVLDPNRQALIAEFQVLQTGTLAFDITGTAFNADGTVAQAGAIIDLFLSATDEKVATAVSDGAGAFRFLIMASGPFYIVAYKAGTPDIAGTTVATLAPSPFTP